MRDPEAAVVGKVESLWSLRMRLVDREARVILVRLRREILVYLGRDEAEFDFCALCLLPLPAGEFESYAFCPWCDLPLSGDPPGSDEARRIIEHRWERVDDIQCGGCGGEYAQPGRYPFRFCPHCGAPFADEDELLIELPFRA
jgi:uncharacterized CHY-type Zn-finger protein